MRADLDFNVEADIVAAARRLLSQLVGTREEAERVRHLSPALGDTLADAGLYRLYLPRAVGGLELPPATAFEVIEVLSKADGSVGWCVMNANAVALGAGWLAPEVGQRPFFMGKPGWIRSSAEFGFSHQSTGQRHAPAERRKVRRCRAVGGKPRIVGQFELTYPVWPQAMLAPDA